MADQDSSPAASAKKVPKEKKKKIRRILKSAAAFFAAVTALVVLLQSIGMLNGTYSSGQKDETSIVPLVISLPQGAEPYPDRRNGEVEAIIDDADGYTNVRSGRGSQYSIIARVVDDEVFYTIPQSNNNWWPVRTSAGVNGYMHQSRIRIN